MKCGLLLASSTLGDPAFVAAMARPAQHKWCFGDCEAGFMTGKLVTLSYTIGGAPRFYSPCYCTGLAGLH